MTTVYLAMKHQQHPYARGHHLEAGTVEEAFESKKAAAEFVAEKNKRATYNLWSVKAKKVKPSNAALCGPREAGSDRADRYNGIWNAAVDACIAEVDSSFDGLVVVLRALKKEKGEK